ncbi:MAG: hypothetical protein SGILL_006856 [Bacillariaceae sp.]
MSNQDVRLRAHAAGLGPFSTPAALIILGFCIATKLLRDVASHWSPRSIWREIGKASDAACDHLVVPRIGTGLALRRALRYAHVSGELVATLRGVFLRSKHLFVQAVLEACARERVGAFDRYFAKDAIRSRIRQAFEGAFHVDCSEETVNWLHDRCLKQVQELFVERRTINGQLSHGHYQLLHDLDANVFYGLFEDVLGAFVGHTNIVGVDDLMFDRLTNHPELIGQQNANWSKTPVIRIMVRLLFDRMRL